MRKTLSLLETHKCKITFVSFLRSRSLGFSFSPNITHCPNDWHHLLISLNYPPPVRLVITLTLEPGWLKDFKSRLPRERNVTITITHDNPNIWWWSNEVCSWPPPPLILEGGSGCSNNVKKTYLLKLISPQWIEQLSSTRAHSKEQTQVFKMSASWAELLNSFRRDSLPKLM